MTSWAPILKATMVVVSCSFLFYLNKITKLQVVTFLFLFFFILLLIFSFLVLFKMYLLTFQQDALSFILLHFLFFFFLWLHIPWCSSFFQIYFRSKTSPLLKSWPQLSHTSKLPARNSARSGLPFVLWF